MRETFKSIPQRQLIRRREAAMMAGWSLPTLRRREVSDPTIPPRIGTGPNGGAPFGYRYADWQRYLDAMVPAKPAVPDIEVGQAKAERARRALAQRRAATPSKANGKPPAGGIVAEQPGDTPKGKSGPTARKSPQRDPHSKRSVPMTDTSESQSAPRKASA